MEVAVDVANDMKIGVTVLQELGVMSSTLAMVAVMAGAEVDFCG
jgi:hypothetical protein